MSEGPFRGNDHAREARIAVLEAEIASLRERAKWKSRPSVLDARLEAKVRNLTAALEKSRVRERRLRERLAESEGPSGNRARVLWMILQVVTTVLCAGALFGRCDAYRARENAPNIAATDYVIQAPRR